MTGKEICKRAKTLKDYKYWYGGKGEIATVDLANRLRRQNPHNWTDSYYKKALKDIDGRTRVGDCSFLVCYAYKVGMIGSYQIVERYKEWKGKPKNGMILWRPGHVAIYCDGKAVQLRGIDYDYVERSLDVDKYKKVLYDINVSYDSNEQVQDINVGWYEDEKGWWYRHTEGTGKDTYCHDGIFLLNTSRGKMFFAFDSDGYMVTDINKLYITGFGNIEYKKE